MPLACDSPSPGLVRRLAAGVYDLLLVAALLWLASLPCVWLAGGVPAPGLVRLAYQLYLLATMFLFYGWFWVHGGQTLGMRAWRLSLVSRDGGPVTWRLAVARFLFAWLSVVCLGLGFGWALLDRERRTWHDIFSGTRLILLPKPAR